MSPPDAPANAPINTSGKYGVARESFTAGFKAGVAASGEFLATQDCLICGAPQPGGHISVRNAADDEIVGRVCSRHSLKEVVFEQQSRIEVRLRIWPDK